MGKICKFAGHKVSNDNDAIFGIIQRVTRTCRHPNVTKYFPEFSCTGKKPYPLCCPYSGVSIKDDIAVGVVTCEGRQENYFIIDIDEESMIRNAARIIFDACKTLNRHYRPLGIDTDFAILKRINLISTVTFLIGDRNNLLDKVMTYELEKYSVVMLSLLEYGIMAGDDMDMMELLKLDKKIRSEMR